MTASYTNEHGTEQSNGYTCVLCGTQHPDREAQLRCCDDLLEDEAHVGSTAREVREAIEEVESDA